MKESQFRTVELPCALASLRRAARALTLQYQTELRPLGLRSTQFSILQVLDRTKEILQGNLGRILALDSTTLTRTLKIMLREGWIAERRGTDRRERLIRLTEAGGKLLTVASERWQRAQERLRQELGEARWRDLFSITNEVTSLTTREGESS